MIIDYNSDCDKARLYEIVDPATLRPLGHEWDDIFYADDSAGIVRVRTRNSSGQFYLAYISDHQTPVSDKDYFRKLDAKGKDHTPEFCIAWHEIRMPIRIIRKSS